MMHKRAQLDTVNPPGQIVNPITGQRTLNDYYRDKKYLENKRVDAGVTEQPAPVLDDELRRLQGEVEALRKWRDEADILATYSRSDGRREWVNVGVWLRPGEIIAHMTARPGDSK